MTTRPHVALVCHTAPTWRSPVRRLRWMRRHRRWRRAKTVCKVVDGVILFRLAPIRGEALTWEVY